MAKSHKRSVSDPMAHNSIGRCPQTGKLCYADKQSAKHHLRLPGFDRTMRAYRCGDCDRWHLGHMRLGTRDAYRPRSSKDRVAVS